MAEHLYIISYDISDQKRWRRVFRLLKGYGEWVQLSVFQCRMSLRRHSELIGLLDGIVKHDADHILIMDLGLADQISPHVVSLGKTFETVERSPIIV